MRFSRPTFKTFIFRHKYLLLLVILAVTAVYGLGTYLLSSSNKKFIPTENPHKIFILNENYTRDEILSVFVQVQRDPTYRTFFLSIPPEEMSTLLAEVTKILLENRTEKDLLYALERKQTGVDESARLFLYIDYPEGFFISQEYYPKLKKIWKQFLFSEFQLKMLWKFYLANYDPNYTLARDGVIWSAVQRLDEVSLRILSQ